MPTWKTTGLEVEIIKSKESSVIAKIVGHDLELEIHNDDLGEKDGYERVYRTMPKGK